MSLGAALLTVAALVVSACGTDDQPDTADDPTASASVPDESPTSTETPSDTPPESPAEAPSESPESPAWGPAASVTGLRGLLPSAADLPGLNAQWRWTAKSTRPASNDPFGACAPTGLLSMGAERGVQRSYAAADGTEPTAEALAVRFVDRTSAERIRRVLVSLHDRCRQRLLDQGADEANLSPVRQVPTGSGAEAWWYLARWTDAGADEGTFHAFGMASQGTRMVLLTMDSQGQDYNYPAGKEPMVRALKQVGKALAPPG
jgi:hypothetical protein